jgi:CRP-like cAMP-binding protein
MGVEARKTSGKTSCYQCPLRRKEIFREFSPPELDFVASFKMGELSVDAGTAVLVEGNHSPHLFTVLDGWGFRYKILQDGRRQILNYVAPGDLIGLQGAVMDEMRHSVEALTPLTLCVFERSRLFGLFEKHPGLGYDMAWIASREESILDEHLLSVGRRSALERAAYLLAFLHRRAAQIEPQRNGVALIPVTQIHVADTLGLSIVHTNKTLRKLVARDLVKWLDRGCKILDAEGLAQLADWEWEPLSRRPFI